jgi:hypothetical protein
VPGAEEAATVAVGRAGVEVHDVDLALKPEDLLAAWASAPYIRRCAAIRSYGGVMSRLSPLVRAVSAATLLSSLTACAEDSVIADGGGSAASPAPSPVADLAIAYDAGDGTAEESFLLRCAEDGTVVAADHPQPEQACDGLATVDEPFAEVPEDAVCTTIFGGPQTAQVTGTLRGESIDSTFTLENGCEITRWQDAAVLAGIGPDPADVQGG